MSNEITRCNIKRFDKWLKRNPDCISSEFRQELTDYLSRETISQSNSKLLPAFDILLLGRPANAGTYFIGKFFSTELEDVFPRWLIEKCHDFSSPSQWYPPKNLLCDFPIASIMEVREGGLSRALYELGQRMSYGFEIDYTSIPFHQITVELCEQYDIDPMTLLSGGCYLLVLSCGNAFCDYVQKKYLIPCTSIGRTIDTKDKILCYRDYKSQINKPKPDGLLQILTGLVI